MKRILTLFFLLAVFGYSFLAKSCNQTEPSNYYRVGRDASWYPLKLMNKEDNLLAFSDDLMLKIAEKESFRVEFLDVGSNNLLNGLKLGQYDAILSSLGPTVIAERQYIFSEPYFLLGPALIVRENSPITSFEELEGKTIGIYRDYSIVFETNKYPQLIILPYDNIGKAFDDLADGDLDGVVTNSLNAYLITHSLYKGKLKVATAPLTNEGLRLIAVRGTRGEKLVELFNQGFYEVKESDLYDQLITKWELFNPE